LNYRGFPDQVNCQICRAAPIRETPRLRSHFPNEGRLKANSNACLHYHVCPLFSQSADGLASNAPDGKHKIPDRKLQFLNVLPRRNQMENCCHQVTALAGQPGEPAYV